MSNKITALYCRSSQKCDDAIANQEAMLRRYAKDNGYNNISVYVNNGFSGLQIDGRPGLDEIRQSMESGSIEAIIVKDFSRIARGIYPLWEFANETERHGVALVSINDGQFQQMMGDIFSHLIPIKA